jgi:hypothetical protein
MAAVGRRSSVLSTGCGAACTVVGAECWDSSVLDQTNVHVSVIVMVTVRRMIALMRSEYRAGQHSGSGLFYKISTNLLGLRFALRSGNT